MTWIPQTWRRILELCSILVVCSGVLGIALKFAVYWDHWVYFPLWPNVMDSLFLILGALYLTLKSLRKK